MIEIKYKGETLKTSHQDTTLSSKDYEELSKEIMKKPDIEEVKKQMKTIHKGGVNVNHVTNYFVKELMYDTKLYHSKWSLTDVLAHEPLMRYFYAKTLTNSKVFPPDKSRAKNMETAFRLGGKGVALKPSNFPMREVDYVLSRYNVNNNYHDASSGWGVRMLSALKNGVNYYSTDPNLLLVDKLKDMHKLYKEVNDVNTIVDIRGQGSEEYIDDFSGKMGLSFTSPPYFNLEDYKHGDQSYKKGMGYVEWLESYYRPTIENIYKYLIVGGYAIMNINNFGDLDLIGDTKRLFKETGFEYVETIPLYNIRRTNSKGGFNDNSEGMIVFRKEEEKL